MSLKSFSPAPAQCAAHAPPTTTTLTTTLPTTLPNTLALTAPLTSPGVSQHEKAARMESVDEPLQPIWTVARGRRRPRERVQVALGEDAL